MLEILAPAGNIESARVAVQSGADAVYLGLTAFSAREGAENFDLSVLQNFLREAHAYGVRVYVAFNTLVKDSETETFIRSILDAWNAGVDAIIMQDIALGKRLKQAYPDIVLHASTQAGVCNVNGAKYIKDCGFSRVILARETPIEEIKKIAQILETEVFVQGALCTCFSGQCYFSSFIGGNSGNRGRCKQPCRKKYFYNRNENTQYSYALSLSDLSVGEDIRKYIEAGVVSFKIEGRMRRPEYVASAVQYYRALLDGKSGETELSRLKRTYNRGNYTKGLAFGQDKRLLSTAVQGHIGEKIGVVKVLSGKYVVETLFRPREGDAFKILRDGQEIGGAYFEKLEKKGFTLRSKTRLKNGDGVFITTDTAVNETVLSSVRKKRLLAISLYFEENQYPVAECGNVRLVGDKRLQSAQNRPLTEEDLTSCFFKTDGLPVEIAIVDVNVSGNIFIPKSELNAFRRAFFAEIEKGYLTYRQQAVYQPFETVIDCGNNDKTALISSDFDGVAGVDEDLVCVYKYDDYRAEIPQNFLQGNFEKFIYYPAFCTSQDEDVIRKAVQDYGLGIYTESYAGVQLATERNVPLFIGTGLNVTNAVALSVWIETGAKYVALSKELNENEAKALAGGRVFVLSTGNIKIMDLCYCPFGKTCAKCDKKQIYLLTDENGREFPVRRWISANGDCRFEVYNCANLVSKGVTGAGKLIDVSVLEDNGLYVAVKDSEEEQKFIYETYTSGHLKRGVL